MRGLTSLIAPSTCSRLSPVFFARSYCTATAKNAGKKYEASLLLPKTTLPMYHSPAKEKELIHDPSALYKWQEQNNEKTGKTWITHDGPPYANGDLHLGHVFNKTLKDFVNRYKLLQGHKVSYVPGWDCHGLPIELKAMEKLRKKEKEAAVGLSATDIRKHARQFATAEVENQKRDFMSLGVMAEWDNPYITMESQYCATQLSVFYSLYSSGYVFRGSKPVHWSPSSRTALADAELEYNDQHVSPSVYVKFPVDKLGEAAKSLEQFSNLHAVIWTTTPWTLPANLAIAISPSIEYCVLKWDDVHYLVAQERVDFLKQKLQSTEPTKEGDKEQTKEGEKEKEKEKEKGEIVATIKGEKLEMTQCVHPLFGRPSPLVLSHHVTTTAGTGLVHTAPGHGEEDFAVGKKYNLPVLCPVDGSGNFTAECGEPSLVGKNVLTHGNKMIIEMLETKGMLIKHEPFTHKYPYDWRTKKPVIVRSTAQWFVDLSRVHEGAVQAIQNVTMVPPNSRLASMVVGRSSWCISRQRVWGVPIPVFYNVKTGEVLLNDESMKHILQVVRTNGTDAWWNLPVSELLPPQYRATADDWKKGEDTMDVWFDSGVSWAAVLKARGIGDLYLEGSDQHRGWFQSSLLTSMCTNGAAPYKAIVTHGFLLDEHGQKMAKSQGNTIAPSTVITGNGNPSQAFGVDVLRMLVASSDYTKDITVGPSILRATREYLGKIRNTLRFALGNTADYVHERDAVPIHLLAPLDKYMLHKLYQVCNNISAAYETYNFSAVFRQILNFCTVELSSFYFSIIKMGLYVELPNDPRRRSAQTVLHLLIETLNKAWAPLVPHVAEDIHTHWTSEGKKPASVFHSGWIKADEAWNDPATAETFTSIIILRDEVTKLLEVMRSQKAIARQEEAEIDLYTDSQDIHNAFTSTHQIVEEVLQVAAVRLHSNANVPATEWASTLTINVNGNPQTEKSQTMPSAHAVGSITVNKKTHHALSVLKLLKH